MLDMIGAVKRAEAAAAERIRRAEETARKAEGEARQEALRIISAAETTAEAWAKEYQIGLGRSLKKEQERKREESRRQCELVKGRAQKHMEQAVRLIVDEICGSDGESG